MGKRKPRISAAEKEELVYARNMEAYLKKETSFMITLINYRKARRMAKGNWFWRYYCYLLGKNPMYYGIFKRNDKTDSKTTSS